MNKLTAAVTLAAALLLSSAPRTAGAAESGADAAIGIYSNYVWRGITLSKEAVVQPTVGLSYGGFGVNMWSNYDIDAKTLNETDVTLNYSGSYGKVGYEAGVIYYGLEGFDDTTELYLSLGYDVILSPTATLYWDVDEGDGGFLVLGVGYSLPVTEGYALDLAADVTVNLDNAVMGTDESGATFSGLYNADFSAGTSVPIGEALSLDLLLAYSLALGDDAKAAIAGAGDGEENVLWGGASLSIAF